MLYMEAIFTVRSQESPAETVPNVSNIHRLIRSNYAFCWPDVVQRAHPECVEPKSETRLRSRHLCFDVGHSTRRMWIWVRLQLSMFDMYVCLRILDAHSRPRSFRISDVHHACGP